MIVVFMHFTINTKRVLDCNVMQWSLTSTQIYRNIRIELISEDIHNVLLHFMTYSLRGFHCVNRSSRQLHFHVALSNYNADTLKKST